MKHFVLKGIKILRQQVLGHGRINYRGQGLLNFIDVGALGDLPEPWFTHAKYIAKLLSFEPLEKAAEHPNIITSQAALWEEEATLPFYIYQGLGGSGSSLFKQNYEYVEKNYESLCQRGNPWLAQTWFERSQLASEQEVRCTTLDQVLTSLSPPISFDFMKIDAQGAEFQILKGGEAFLENHCLGLQLELFNIPLYKGIALLPEVESYLASKGFELVKKYLAHGSFASQHDCVFLKKHPPEAAYPKMQLLRKVYDLPTV